MDVYQSSSGSQHTDKDRQDIDKLNIKEEDEFRDFCAWETEEYISGKQKICKN